MASRMIAIVLALLSITAVTAKQDFMFISNFNRLTMERLDPIISPGVVSGHVHHVFGGNVFSPSVDPSQAASSSCTTGDITADKSIYWNPAVYWQAKNGSFIAAKHEYSRVYYEGRPVDDNEKIYAFPPGFRMVAGNPFRRSAGTDNAAKAVTWACAGSGVAESQNIPAIQCSQRMRPQVGFPMCWDGMRVDSANHQDHVAYPTGGAQDFGPCPCTHPYKLPHLHFENYYFNEGIDELDQLYRDGKQPLVLANGDPTGYGFHGDFINGWDQAKLEQAVNTCRYGGFDESIQNQCPLLAGTASGYSKDTCTLAPQVNEVVDGAALPALPGCNPVTQGPGQAQPVTDCKVTPATTGSYGSSSKSGDVYLDTAKRPPPMAASKTCPAYDNSGNAPSSSGSSASGSMGISSSSGSNSMMPGSSTATSPTEAMMRSSTMGLSSGSSDSMAASSMTAASSTSTSSAAATTMTASISSSSMGTSPSVAAYGPAVSSSSPSAASSSSPPPSPSSSSTSGTAPTVPQSWSSLGCYVDTLTPRSLPYWSYYSDQPITSSSCAASCQKLSYKYAGTENGGQCFCGNDLPKEKAMDQTECSMLCKAGGTGEVCGGKARLSIFGADAGTSGTVKAQDVKGGKCKSKSSGAAQKRDGHLEEHVKRSTRHRHRLS